MGEVYRASLVGELGFEKPLVIKTILPELASQPRFIEMFAAEAKTAVALNHGNIVPIYELGRAEDTFYIVMGYVDGPSVAQLLAAHRRKEQPPPLPVALSIVRGVLSGLAYAHTEEPGRPAVVHRDVTPRNVMVDRSGQVRIVDFGIALPARAATATRAGSIGYVAPEQARGGTVDPRADVFSAACLLYELVTLERAFPHEGVWTVPELTALPPAVQAPLTRALSLDPAERPADASAFLGTLGEAITRHAPTFSESDLAAHLRSIHPDGRWEPTEDSKAAGDVEDVTPTTRVRPTTMTFATRLTAVTSAPADTADEAEPDSIDGSRKTGATTDAHDDATRTTAPATPSRTWPVALITATAALVGLWLWSQRSPSSDRDSMASRVSPGTTPSITVPVPPRAHQDGSPDDDAHVAGSGSGSSSGATGSTTSLVPHEPLPPALVLHVDPPDATVRIGTQRFEGGSPFTLPLPTRGMLEAIVEHPEHEPQTIELRAGAPGERSVTLASAPKAPRGRGSLQVLAPSVSWAEVTVDGRRFGVTPTRKLELAAGDHRVVVRCIPDVCPEPRILLRRTVEIEPGQTLRVTAQ